MFAEGLAYLFIGPAGSKRTFARFLEKKVAECGLLRGLECLDAIIDALIS